MSFHGYQGLNDSGVATRKANPSHLLDETIAACRVYGSMQDRLLF